MSKPVPKPGFSDSASDAMAEMRATLLRTLIASIPEHERPVVFAKLADILSPPRSTPSGSKEPRRGGDLLNNVFHIYKTMPRTPMGVPDVASDLAAKGVKVGDTRRLYNCVGYLKSRKIIMKVAPGKYVLSDGSEIDTDIQKGGAMEY